MQGGGCMKDKRAPPERRKHQDSTGKRKHKRKEEEPVMGPGNEQKNTGFCFPEYLKNINNEQKNKQNKNPVPVMVMGFFSSAISILQTLVSAIGAGLGVWGVINLLEGYGNDNPGAKSQGIKQLMAGGGVILIGTQLVPQLSGLFG